MNGIEAVLRRVDADLRRLGALWALVGGFGVSVRAEPRFTRAVGVAMAVSGDDEAVDVVRALIACGYRLLMSSEQDTVERLATVRLAHPVDWGVVDVLFASSGVEPEIACWRCARPAHPTIYDWPGDDLLDHGTRIPPRPRPVPRSRRDVLGVNTQARGASSWTMWAPVPARASRWGHTAIRTRSGFAMGCEPPTW